MKAPIKFGRTAVFESNGNRLSISEQVIAHHAIVKRATQTFETIHVKDEKEILAQFLKLLDRQKAGEIDQVGIQCLRNPQTQQLRIEVSWFDCI